MSNIFIKTSSPEDWKELLADKDKHWKTGYSAKSLAYSWEEAEDFPRTVKQVFSQSDNDALKTLELLYAFPEYKVELPGGKRPSQNDLYVLAKNNKGLMTIMVEGKVDEPFNKTINEWIKVRSNGIENARLRFLLEQLHLTDKNHANLLEIRYQLLHRAVSSIIEAKRIGASQSMILVHSFSPEDSRFEDFRKFVNLFGFSIKINDVQGPKKIDSIEVYFCWVKSD